MPGQQQNYQQPNSSSNNNNLQQQPPNQGNNSFNSSNNNNNSNPPPGPSSASFGGSNQFPSSMPTSAGGMPTFNNINSSKPPSAGSFSQSPPPSMPPQGQQQPPKPNMQQQRGSVFQSSMAPPPSTMPPQQQQPPPDRFGAGAQPEPSMGSEPSSLHAASAATTAAKLSAMVGDDITACPTQEQLAGVIKVGFLARSEGALKSWKKRWYRMHADVFVAYDKQPSKQAWPDDAPPTLLIPLQMVSDLQMEKNNDAGTTWEFQCMQKKFSMRCESRNDTQAWLSAMRRVVEVAVRYQVLGLVCSSLPTPGSTYSSNNSNDAGDSDRVKVPLGIDMATQEKWIIMNFNIKYYRHQQERERKRLS
jgi:hypothetical protein